MSLFLPAWLEPWKGWLLAVPAILVAVLVGWLVIMRPRGGQVALEERGGLTPEDLEPWERSRVQEVEAELLEADAELQEVLAHEDLDTRSDELAGLLNRRRSP